jgi:hypothetical protein
MHRRAMVLTLGSGILVACAPNVKPLREQPIVAASKPADAPPPSRIQRLLLWLPPPTATQVRTSLYGGTKLLFDNSVFGGELKKQFQSAGIDVVEGTGTPLELNRGDDQRALMARFKLAQRFEVDVVNVESMQQGTRSSSIAFMKWQLFNANSSSAMRFGNFAVTGDRQNLTERADYIFAQLKLEGFV